ncbi:plasmodesmata callose-binding protein 5 [Sesamum alatum]|uniref:Plasmodesmata callose-binding protein 5 n=1 Tax=Sesamum alatum TaxID=300844 RepID=A0AAE1Y0B5_9LAMI|nr:plasmodesmata callose-binding protein 5 [Sesamum alatum]
MGSRSFAVTLISLLSSLIVSASVAAQGGGGGPRELWCVAKNNAEDAALQSALDWACGAGGADCGPIQTGGPCYDASDLQRTASFAFNDYFLKHGLSEDSCDFSNTAALTSLNPSHNNCKFRSSLTAGTGNFSGPAAAGSDNADLTSSNSITRRWGWGSIAVHLIFAIRILF